MVQYFPNFKVGGEYATSMSSQGKDGSTSVVFGSGSTSSGYTDSNGNLIASASAGVAPVNIPESNDQPLNATQAISDILKRQGKQVEQVQNYLVVQENQRQTVIAPRSSTGHPEVLANIPASARFSSGFNSQLRQQTPNSGQQEVSLNQNTSRSNPIAGQSTIHSADWQPSEVGQQPTKTQMLIAKVGAFQLVQNYYAINEQYRDDANQLIAESKLEKNKYKKLGLQLGAVALQEVPNIPLLVLSALPMGWAAGWGIKLVPKLTAAAVSALSLKVGWDTGKQIAKDLPIYGAAGAGERQVIRFGTATVGAWAGANIAAKQIAAYNVQTKIKVLKPTENPDIPNNAFQRRTPMGNNKYIVKMGDQGTLKGKIANFEDLQAMNQEAGNPYIYRYQNRAISLERNPVKVSEKVPSSQTVLDQPGLSARMAKVAKENPTFGTTGQYIPRSTPMEKYPTSGYTWKLLAPKDQPTIEFNGNSLNLARANAVRGVPNYARIAEPTQTTIRGNFISDFRVNLLRAKAGFDTILVKGIGQKIIQPNPLSSKPPNVVVSNNLGGKISIETPTRLISPQKEVFANYENLFKSVKVEQVAEQKGVWKGSDKPFYPAKEVSPSPKNAPPSRTVTRTQAVESETQFVTGNGKVESLPKTWLVESAQAEQTSATSALNDWRMSKSGQQLYSQVEKYDPLGLSNHRLKDLIVSEQSGKIYALPLMSAYSQSYEAAVRTESPQLQENKNRTILAIDPIYEQIARPKPEVLVTQSSKSVSTSEIVTITSGTRIWEPNNDHPIPSPLVTVQPLISLPDPLPAMDGSKPGKVPPKEEQKKDKVKPFFSTRSEARLPTLSTPGYDVYAKVFGKYKKLNERPVTKDIALDLGSRATDTQISATFRVRGSTQAAQTGLQNTGFWDRVKHKYYSRGSEAKMGNTLYIERPRYRIDTSSEYAQIAKAKKVPLINIRGSFRRMRL